MNPITVRVETAGGKPLAGATVVCIDSLTKATLKGTVIEGGGARLQTDAEGKFTLPAADENLFFAIATDQGFSLSQSRDLTSLPTMVFQPWGRIEGVRLNNSRPMPDQPIRWRFGWRQFGTQDILSRFGIAGKSATDAEGRFVFERVPPGPVIFNEFHQHAGNRWFGLPMGGHVKPGVTTQVSIETHGRPVIGHLEMTKGLPVDVDPKSITVDLKSDVDTHAIVKPALPAELDTPEKRNAWWQAWDQTSDGRNFRQMFARLNTLVVLADGSLIADNVEPGNYQALAYIERNGNIIATSGQIHFVVPPAAPGAEDEPFDLGKVTVKPTLEMKPGVVAPDFEVKTLAGAPLKLSDFRGKHVLLDFWATWCGPCIAELPSLKETHDAFANDERLAIISLSVDADPEAPGKFVEANDLPWTQVFLGEWSKDVVTQNYGIYSLPTIILIGPDGKIIAGDLRGPGIKAAVTLALKGP